MSSIDKVSSSHHLMLCIWKRATSCLSNSLMVKKNYKATHFLTSCFKPSLEIWKSKGRKTWLDSPVKNILKVFRAGLTSRTCFLRSELRFGYKMIFYHISELCKMSQLSNKLHKRIPNSVFRTTHSITNCVATIWKQNFLFLSEKTEKKDKLQFVKTVGQCHNECDQLEKNGL